MPKLAFRLIAVLILTGLLPAATAGGASAKTHVFRASELKRSGTLVFKLRGVSRSSVRGGHVRIGVRRKRLRLKRLRRAATRGALGVRPARRYLRRPSARAALRVRLYLRTRSRRARSHQVTAPATALRPFEPRAIPADARYVSTTGSDSAAGNEQAPWRTLEHAADTAPEGSTVVIRTGTYGARGTITRLSRSGVTFTGHPAEPRPVLLGQVRLEGAGVELSHVVLAGPTGGVARTSSDNPGGEDVQLWIKADRATLSDSEVRDNRWHAGVFVSDATGVRIVHNHIHHNGAFGNPAQANLDHGIYWASGSGTIADNRIEDNYAYGVHLYPEADGVVVERNHITGHGRGGVIVAQQSARSLVADNTVERNRVGVQGYALTGQGNVVRGNLVRHNADGNFVNTAGLLLLDNR